jgi:hypothetical protein
MCNTQEEDWIHILTCPSIEACMNREESWVKAMKTMKHWRLSNDFWTALEICVHGFTRDPAGGAIETPLPPTYDNSRNHLKLAFREQDKKNWDNLLKGNMGKQWIEYVKKHLEHEKIKLQAKEWAPKMILVLWDHMLRLWQYRNNALHEYDSTRVAQFKIEAIDGDIGRLAARHNDLRRKLHEVQENTWNDGNTFKRCSTTAANVGRHWQNCIWTKLRIESTRTPISWSSIYRAPSASDNQ